MKSMIKKVLVRTTLLLSAIYFCSCSPTNDSDKNVDDDAQNEYRERYGGTFRLNETEYFASLFPHHISDDVSYRIASNVYEGLLKLNPLDLKVENCLAEKYTIDKSGTKYTFHLKKGIYFHNNRCFPGGKGRELEAKDVAYCFSELCVHDELNIGYSIFKDLIVGASSYYEASKSGKHTGLNIEGIKVIDKYTIELTLIRPSSVFFYNLAGPFCYIYPKEAFEKYGSNMRIQAVGTGPFQLDPKTELDYSEDGHLLLVRNPHYHQKDKYGNQLPYLDDIEITFLHDKREEMELFKQGKYHMIYRLPTQDIIHLLDPSNHELDPFVMEDIGEMSVHYLGFNNQEAPFDDVNLRRAFSYSLDRKYITDGILSGEADEPAYYGITPKSFVEYHSEEIKGYRYNKDSAMHYFKLSNYFKEGRKDHIVLYLTADGDRNSLVAQYIKKQINEILNIDVRLSYLELPELEEHIELGHAQFYLSGWLYSYPHPQHFLNTFYSKNVDIRKDLNAYPNITRYKNPEFDRYYEEGLHAKSNEITIEDFHKAEQVLMNDAGAIPLWYDECYRFLQPSVKNFHLNPLQYRDFRTVYFELPLAVKEVP